MDQSGTTPEHAPTAGTTQPWVSRVYIVDDHRFFTFALMALVNSQADLSVCGVAHDEATALNDLVRVSPDVIVIDVRLSSQSGLSMAAAVRRFSKYVPILFVSSLQNPSFAQESKWLEPCSFVEKSQDPVDIIRGIRQALAKLRLLTTLHPSSTPPPPRENERATLNPRC